MDLDFPLDHQFLPLASDERFHAFANELGQQKHIRSQVSFNKYCRNACQLWHSHFHEHPLGTTSPRFTELLDKIYIKAEKTIPTGWGGVVITLHEPPQVEKYLVVRKGYYLALEKHEQKDEHIEVAEGAGLLLWRHGADQSLAAQALTVGAQFHFIPGIEHCIIGTENLLVFERSTDPKGMDQDLIFLYEPTPLPV